MTSSNEFQAKAMIEQLRALSRSIDIRIDACVLHDGAKTKEQRDDNEVVIHLSDIRDELLVRADRLEGVVKRI